MSKIKQFMIGLFTGVILFAVLPYFIYGTVGVFGYDQLSRLLSSNTTLVLLVYFVLAFLILTAVNIIMGKSFPSSLLASLFLVLGLLAAYVTLIFYGGWSLVHWG